MMDCALLLATTLDSISTSNSVSISNSIQQYMQFNPKEVSNLLWHYRFGHLSVPRIQLLQQTHNEIKISHSEHCIVYPLANQHRLSFPVHTIASKHAFELLHVDILGSQ